MKKIILTTLLCLHLCVSALFAKTYGVVVGVSEYQMSKNNLHFADQDAKDFYGFLAPNKTEYNLVLLTNEQATCANIINAMQTQFAKAKSTDKIIFYMSSHGAEGYLIPYDFNGYANGLALTKVKELFRQSSAGVKYLFTDACHAGSIKDKSTPSVGAKEFLSALKKGMNIKANSTSKVIVLVSSRSTQSSIESSAITNGAFTYTLLNALRGEADLDTNAAITLKELYTYMRSSVMQLTNNKQIPTMFGNFNDNDVIIYLK